MRSCKNCGKENVENTMGPALCVECSAAKSNITSEKLRHLYWDEELTTYQIGDLMGMNAGQVRYWMRKLKVPSRTASEAERLSFSKGRKPDTNKRGSESSNWKGGRWKDGSGYIYAYCPGHPRAVDKHVMEHILVWEKANKQSVPEGYQIHHLNGIRDDNREENLVGISRKDHNKIDRLKLAEDRIHLLERELSKYKAPGERT